MSDSASASSLPDHYTTLEVARLLGLAVRSVQLMADRKELEAWKTAGGHRRISRASVERWINTHQRPVRTAAPEPANTPLSNKAQGPRYRVLLIEDSVHYQNLVGLLIKQHFPEVSLHVATDGVNGLVMYGDVKPDVLIVDILLPGIDGATLISSLRTHPQFGQKSLMVVTSLDAQQRGPFAFALEGIPVIHKPQLVQDFPAQMRLCLNRLQAAQQPADAY